MIATVTLRRSLRASLTKKLKPGGSQTLYAGGIFEVDKTSGGTVTRTVSYYPLGGAIGAGVGTAVTFVGVSYGATRAIDELWWAPFNQSVFSGLFP